MNTKYVSWKTITPIIGDVVVSPWNLLIGGLLIQQINFKFSLLSIFIGYSCLGLLFYFYGCLGLKYRLKTSELIEPIFGKKGTKYLFSSILALGQIGWFAIITYIGGESLGHLLNIGTVMGVVIYAVLMYWMAVLELHNMGIVKLVITISSIALIAYLMISNFSMLNFSSLWNDSSNTKSLLWGVSIIVSSLISFGTVTPDFFSQIIKKKDALITIVLGLVIPGIVITSVGAMLFHGMKKLSFELLIGTASFSILGYIFNIMTNTDASIAIYTPGNRLKYMFKLNFKVAVAIVAIIGTALGLLNITDKLELWLKVLGGIYPSIIAVTIVYYYLFQQIKMTSMASIFCNFTVLLLGVFIFIFDSTFLIWAVFIGAFLLSIINMQYLKSSKRIIKHGTI